MIETKLHKIYHLTVETSVTGKPYHLLDRMKQEDHLSPDMMIEQRYQGKGHTTDHMTLHLDEPWVDHLILPPHDQSINHLTLPLLDHLIDHLMPQPHDH